MEITSYSMDLSTHQETVICKWKDENGELNMTDFPVEGLDII